MLGRSPTSQNPIKWGEDRRLGTSPSWPLTAPDLGHPGSRLHFGGGATAYISMSHWRAMRQVLGIHAGVTVPIQPLQPSSPGCLGSEETGQGSWFLDKALDL